MFGLQPGQASNPFAPAPPPGQVVQPSCPSNGGCGGSADPTGPYLGKGTELKKLYNMPEHMGHSDGINCMAMVDGKLYSGGRDSQLFMWRGQPSSSSSLELVQEGAPLVLPSSVNTLFFDSPSQWLFAGLWNGQIQGWCKQPVLNDMLSGHRKSVASLTMHSGVLISGSADATVRLWTMNPQVGRFQAHGEPISCLGGMVSSVKVLNDALWVGSSQAITCIDLATLQVRGAIQCANAVASMLDYENHMFVTFKNGDVTVFGPAGDQVYNHPSRGEHKSNTAVELMTHPITRKPMLLCGQQFGYVTAYDLPEFKPRGSFCVRHSSDVRSIVDLKSDGIFATGGAQGDISLWQWAAPGGSSVPATTASPFAPSGCCGGGCGMAMGCMGGQMMG